MKTAKDYRQKARETTEAYNKRMAEAGKVILRGFIPKELKKRIELEKELTGRNFSEILESMAVKYFDESDRKITF